MSLDAKLVVEAYAVVLGEALDDQEARKLAQVLCSREELLASLVIHKRGFGSNAALAAALLKAAASHHVETRTPRLDQADFTRVVAARQRARRALGLLIEAEKSSTIDAKEVGENLRDLARLEPMGPSHPGARWRIQSEP